MCIIKASLFVVVEQFEVLEKLCSEQKIMIKILTIRLVLSQFIGSCRTILSFGEAGVVKNKIMIEILNVR